LKQTSYGNLVDTGIPHDDKVGTHGIFEVQGSVNIRDMSTMPTELQIKSNRVTGLDSRGPHDFLVLQLSGDVLGDEETLRVCYVVPWMDAGRLAALLIDAARRSPGDHSAHDFELGFDQEIRNAQDRLSSSD
jgi:hypothetical protein